MRGFVGMWWGGLKRFVRGGGRDWWGGWVLLLELGSYGEIWSGLGSVCVGVEWTSVCCFWIKLYDVHNESGDTILSRRSFQRI